VFGLPSNNILMSSELNVAGDVMRNVNVILTVGLLHLRELSPQTRLAASTRFRSSAAE